MIWHIRTAHWWSTPNSVRTIPGRERTALTASLPTAWWGNAQWKRWAIFLSDFPSGKL